MKINFLRLVAIAIALIAVTSGCVPDNQSSKPKDAIVIQTSLGDLPKFINLPATPTHVKWQTEQLNGDNWSLTAMLQFTKADFDRILSQSTKLDSQAKSKVPKSYLFNLLPESINRRYQDKNTEDLIEVDANTVAPNVFIDVNKSPLVNGDVVVFEKENIFLLSLYTM